MTAKVRISIACVALAGVFGLVYFSGPAYAAQDKDLKVTVQKIADAFKKGDKDAAAKMAAVAARSPGLIEEIPDLMHLYRPTGKGGLGLQNLLKNPAVKNADRVGHLVAAMAELTLAKGSPNDARDGKTKKAWADFSEQLRAAGLELAKAKNANGINAAGVKINNACIGCHSRFKD